MSTLAIGVNVLLVGINWCFIFGSDLALRGQKSLTGLYFERRFCIRLFFTLLHVITVGWGRTKGWANYIFFGVVPAFMALIFWYMPTTNPSLPPMFN